MSPQAGERTLAEALELHVSNLAGRIGERHHGRPEAYERAALYIETVLADHGYAVRREEFPAGGAEARNIVVETDPPGDRPFLLVGAHYDTVPGSPGADDNASGVAVLLEAAKALRRERPGLPVRLAAFADEEPPYFDSTGMGSAVHANRARRAGERILGMVSLEMVGCYDDRPRSQEYPPLLSRFYPDRGDFIALVSDLRSLGFFRRMKEGLRSSKIRLESAALPRWTPGVSLSDHLSFWKAGYPAVMLTDTSFYRNPRYHMPTDTPDTLDYARMALLTEGLVRVLKNF